MFRRALVLLATGGLCLAGVVSAAEDAAAPRVPAFPTLNDVAPATIVTVNGTPVTRESLAALAILLDRDRLLDAVITVEVVRQEAAKRGVGITPAEVDAAALRATTEELDAAARRLGLKNQADAVARGKMTAEEAAAERVRLSAWYRPMAAFNLITEKLMLLDFKITDDDVRAEFDRQYGPRVRVRQIVLRSREDAEDALNRLNAGADFAQLARDLSVDRVSGAKGGEMPLLPRSTPLLSKAAMALKPGQIAPIAQIGDSFHVVKVVELVPEEKKDFNEVRETLLREVIARLVSERRPGWIRELRARYTIRPSTDVTGAKPNEN